MDTDMPPPPPPPTGTNDYCPDGCVSGFVANGGCSVIESKDMSQIVPYVPTGLGCLESPPCAPIAFNECGVPIPPGMGPPPPPPMGTCEGACGGEGGGCWCDSYCSNFGDCCDDFTADCPAIATSGRRLVGTKKSTRPTKALSKRPIDVRARKAAAAASKKAVVVAAAAKRPLARPTKALSQRPVDVQSRSKIGLDHLIK